MVNIGLVGCGRICSKHINSIVQIPNGNILGVCDIISERAINTAKKIPNCKHYTNFDEILANKDIDTISICTPSGLHPEMTIKAAKAGKNVICEKPMGMTLKDSKNMIHECKDNGVKLFIVKQNRYNPPIVELKKAIDNNRFGKIFLANATIRWSRDQNYYNQAEWRGKVLHDGGVILNQTSHHIDMLRWLNGEVDSVTCKKKTFAHDIETEDGAVALLKFKNNSLGTYEGTTCTYPRDLEGSISILGEKGSVKVGGFAMNKMETWQFNEETKEDNKIKHTITNPPNVYGYGHLPFYRNVIDAIELNKRPKIDGDEGINTMRLIIAMLKSAKLNKEVYLDELDENDDQYYY